MPNGKVFIHCRNRNVLAQYHHAGCEELLSTEAWASTKAMILIIVSLVLSLAAYLIARSPFAVAARSPL